MAYKKGESKMEKATLEILYEKVSQIQRDIEIIKKRLEEEPELRDEFIQKMKDLELESSIPVDDFGKRYGLN